MLEFLGRLAGTLNPYFRIGPASTGVRLKNSSGVLELRDAADAAYASVHADYARALLYQPRTLTDIYTIPNGYQGFVPEELFVTGSGEVVVESGAAFWQVHKVEELSDDEVMFVQTADKTLATSTIETSIFSSGIGTRTFEADSLEVGDTILIRFKGIHSTPASPGSHTLKVKLNGTTVLTTGLRQLTASIPGRIYNIDILLTVRSIGASGAIRGHMQSGGSVNAATASTWFDAVSAADVTINTTIPQTLDVTWQYSTAAAGHTFTFTNAVMRLIKAKAA